MRLILKIFFCFLFGYSAHAQDGHYSQVYQNPLYLNPALVGGGVDAIRVGGIYRSQWKTIKTPYSTYGIFADSKINDFSIGVFANQNKAGVTGYSKTNAVLAIGYQKPLGRGKNSLSLGGQLGLNQISIDPNILTFDEQYTPGIGFDETLQSNEDFVTTSMKMTDVNIGVAYRFESNWGIPVKGEIGMGIYHVNAPQAPSFTGEIIDFPRKAVFHSSLNIQLYKSFGVEPMMMLAGQGSAREFIAGLKFGFLMTDSLGFKIGVGSRFNDAIIFTTQFKINRMTLGLGFDYNTSNLRQAGASNNAMEISLVYNLPSKDQKNTLTDRDADGVLDEEDDCPDVPGVLSLKGCPEELGAKEPVPLLGPDYDKDGILDHNDLCPYEFGYVQFQGCNDQDADGIWDHIDVCPSLPGKVENQGCPVEIPGIDSDRDGVPDRFDKCIYIKGLEEFNGCPDTDGDGISDLRDECPYLKGSRAWNGCPGNPVKETLRSTTNLSNNVVEFATNQYYISSNYRSLLNQIAEKLNQKSHYQLVIEGHTDNEGNATYNFQLSQRRANAVRDYMIARGVRPEAIEVYHYGENKPKTGNESESGKARNRRVELIIFD